MTGPMLRYRSTPEHPWTVIQFKADTDPFVLLEAVRAKLYPGVEVVRAVPSVPARPTKRRRAA